MPNAEFDQSLLDWISIPHALRLIEYETGWKFTRQSFYNWARAGRIRTNGIRPLRTTRKYVYEFLAERRQCLKH